MKIIINISRDLLFTDPYPSLSLYTEFLNIFFIEKYPGLRSWAQTVQIFFEIIFSKIDPYTDSFKDLSYRNLW